MNVATPDAKRTSAAKGTLYVVSNAARRRSAAKWQSAIGDERTAGEAVLPRMSLRSARVANGSTSEEVNEEAFTRNKYDSGGGTVCDCATLVSAGAPAWSRLCGPGCCIPSVLGPVELMMSVADNEKAPQLPAARAEAR
eukprot:4490457-Pleurochrysis_carterae.AAC.1